jgi:dihydroorotate dehydrogenase (fumarate)
MADLRTNYLGLELKNPIIAGASSLSKDVSGAKALEEAGVGAIIYKSLFEEQIQLEQYDHDEGLEEYANRNAEMISLFPRIEHSGAKEHLLALKAVKEAVSIPVIASLNCVYDVSWEDYALQLAETGVDALELNFYSTPKTFTVSAEDIEAEQIAILANLKKKLNIPIAVKLSPYYSNPLRFIKRLDDTGVDAVVIFNKLFQPDINIDTEENEFSYILSSEYDNRIVIRYSGLLYGNINADISANSGIHTGEDVIKVLLAGAGSAQVVSALYKNNINYVKTILSDIESWMDRKGYATIKDFQGKLSSKNNKDPFAYKRSQYVDLLLNSKEVLEKQTTR